MTAKTKSRRFVSLKAGEQIVNGPSKIDLIKARTEGKTVRFYRESGELVPVNVTRLVPIGIVGDNGSVDIDAAQEFSFTLAFQFPGRTEVNFWTGRYNTHLRKGNLKSHVEVDASNLSRVDMNVAIIWPEGINPTK